MTSCGLSNLLMSPSSATSMAALIRENAPHGLEGLDHRVEPPMWRQSLNLLGKALHPRLALLNAIRCTLERQSAEPGEETTGPKASGDGPASICCAPKSSVRAEAETHSAAASPFSPRSWSYLPRSGQISHGFVLGQRDVNRFKLTGPVETGQCNGISPVCLDSLPWLLRSLRRGHNDAVEPLAYAGVSRFHSRTGRLRRRT